MTGVLKGVKYEDPVVRYRGERVVSIAKRLSRRLVLDDVDTAIDVFYSFYLPYPIVAPFTDLPSSKVSTYYLIKELIEDPEFHRVKVHTIANAHMSTLIAASFLTYLSEELERELGGEGDGEGSTSEEMEIDRASMSRAVRRAMNRLVNETKAIKGIEKLLSIGTQAGVGTAFDLEESGDEVIRLARNADVRKLLEVISSLPLLIKRVRRSVEYFSRGELRGYELGSDLERIVPTELKLPKIYFRIKFAENKLLLYEKVLPKSLGPFYVLIDKSGSMDGEKILWAKATAIALFMRARKEFRDFYLRFFDGIPHPLIKVPRRMKASEVLRLIRYLARVRSGGGTDITKAIVTACDDIMSGVVKSRSDIVIITDGEDRISENLIEKKLKAANSRLVTVMVIGENKSLRRVSDKYLRVLKLSGDEILRVVEA